MPSAFTTHTPRLKVAPLLCALVAAALGLHAARTIGQELQLARRPKVNISSPRRAARLALSFPVREPGGDLAFAPIREPGAEPVNESPAEPRLYAGPMRLVPPEVEPLPSPRESRSPEEIPPPAASPQSPPEMMGAMPQSDPCVQIAPFSMLDFAPDPLCYDASPEANSADATYRTKYPLPVQRPWIEWGRGFYLPGQYPPGGTFFGHTNLTLPHFLVYGDLRTVLASNESNNVRTDVWATTLQLENDLKITATERFHTLLTPFNRLNDVTRLQRLESGDVEFFDVFNANPTTAFFEGDAGAIIGGMRGIDSPFDLPFTVGLVPLFFQNGVWMNDAILGFAVNIPSRNSPFLDWPNYEVTFFAGFDQVTSDAFPGDNQAADVFGMATFIEAYGGYIETGYALLSDDTAPRHTYHNLTAAFTRRYFGRVSNSVRGIVNFGQESGVQPQTADGLLLLMENSLITSQPSNVVPYFNLFAGFGSPQSVARGAAAGGVLTNTGLSFEIDNITNYPTLDATGHNSCGGALGIEILGPEFFYQFVIETAYVHVFGNPAERLAVGDQASISGRFQVPLSKSVLLRTDIIYGALEDAPDILGGRVEIRHKF